MNIQYVIDGQLAKPFASTYHALGICRGFTKLGHQVQLGYYGPELPPQTAISVSEGGVIFPHPEIRGGIRIATWSMDNWLLSQARLNPRWRLYPARGFSKVDRGPLKRPDIWYFRIIPNQRRIQAIRALHEPRVLEINGADILNWPGGPDLCRSVDVILVGSDSVRALVAERTGVDAARIGVHMNAAMDTGTIMVEDKMLCRTQLGLSKDDHILLYISQMRWYHDKNTILRAFRELIEADHDEHFVLIIVGSGAEYESVRNENADLVAARRLLMPGQIPLDRISSFIGASDICINMLKSEKLLIEGNLQTQKLYDYIAGERPTIESVEFHADVPDWARRSLCLVQPECVEDLVAAIRRITAEYSKWEMLAKCARRRLLAHRTWSLAASLSLNLIEELINTHTTK